MAAFTDAKIEKKLAALNKAGKFQSCSSDTNERIIMDLNTSVFTNLIKEFFPAAYVRSQRCPDCGGKAAERCHGVGEERGILLARALEKVHPDPDVPVKLIVIVGEFLRQHINTKFTFKCKACHLAERKRKNVNALDALVSKTKELTL